MATPQEWEARQQEKENVALIADYVGKSAMKTFWQNQIGMACALASIFAVNQPVLAATLPTGILLLQSWISRMETRNLRHRFNEAAATLSPEGLEDLRPLHNVIPTDNKFTMAELDHKKYPIRVWGAAAAGLLLGPSLAGIWLGSDILAREGSLNLKIKQTATQLHTRLTTPQL